MLYNFESVLDRVKRILNAQNDKEVAEAIGMHPSAFNNRKRAKSIPHQQFVVFANKRKINLNWLFFGHGPQFIEKGFEDSAASESGPELESGQSSFLNEATVPINVTNLIKKTLEILDSKTIYSKALAANIEAFNESAKAEQRINDMARRFDELEDNLEQKLEKKFKSHLEGLEAEVKKLREENKVLKKNLDDPPDVDEGTMAAS